MGPFEQELRQQQLYWLSSFRLHFTNHTYFTISSRYLRCSSRYYCSFCNPLVAVHINYWQDIWQQHYTPFAHISPPLVLEVNSNNYSIGNHFFKVLVQIHYSLFNWAGHNNISHITPLMAGNYSSSALHIIFLFSLHVTVGGLFPLSTHNSTTSIGTAHGRPYGHGRWPYLTSSSRPTLAAG